MTKLHKSVGGTDIVALGANAQHLFLLVYLQAKESKNALAGWQLLYLFVYVVNSIRDALGILITDDTLHLLHLPIYLRLDGLQIGVSDPTMKVKGEHTIVLDGTYTLDGTHDKVSVKVSGSKTTVTINMTGLDGQTVLFNLKK